MASLNFAATTHVGHVREINEDSYLARPEIGLWLVADGMGGHDGGDIASSLASDYIGMLINQGETLEQAILKAHDAVRKAAVSGHGMPGMGSTVVALRSLLNCYQVAWVGDSRAYLWADGQLTQLSKDHSYVQFLIDSGAISSSEANNHPQKHVITQSLGMPDTKSLQVDKCDSRWAPGQKVLLCSDGLTNELSDEEIARILGEYRDNEDAVNQLTEAALKKGGRDNITVVLVASGIRQSFRQRLRSAWERVFENMK